MYVVMARPCVLEIVYMLSLALFVETDSLVLAACSNVISRHCSWRDSIDPVCLRLYDAFVGLVSRGQTAWCMLAACS